MTTTGIFVFDCNEYENLNSNMEHLASNSKYLSIKLFAMIPAERWWIYGPPEVVEACGFGGPVGSKSLQGCRESSQPFILSINDLDYKRTLCRKNIFFNFL